jgi:hypothetical protein
MYKQLPICCGLEFTIQDYSNFDSAIETHPKKHMMKNLA